MCSSVFLQHCFDVFFLLQCVPLSPSSTVSVSFLLQIVPLHPAVSMLSFFSRVFLCLTPTLFRYFLPPPICYSVSLRHCVNAFFLLQGVPLSLPILFLCFLSYSQPTPTIFLPPFLLLPPPSFIVSSALPPISTLYFLLFSSSTITLLRCRVLFFTTKHFTEGNRGSFITSKTTGNSIEP